MAPHGGYYWQMNRGEVGRFSEIETPALFLSVASTVVVSFLEIELPLTSKRISLKVPGNRRAGSVVSQQQTISPRCIHWRSNWVKCPPSKLA